MGGGMKRRGHGRRSVREACKGGGVEGRSVREECKGGV
jgi:hypothetical protein